MRRRTFLTRSTQAAATLGALALGCRGERATGARGAPEHPAQAEAEASPGDHPPQPPAQEAAEPEIAAPAQAGAATGPDTMDDALALLRGDGPGGGNHAPMGAEALIAMGRGDLVVKWVEGYRRRERMVPRPGGRVLPAAEQTPALGKQDRIGDWMATFRREIVESPWRDVLRGWLPRLMPGMAAAATHGIIRTSHALRSLDRADTELRRNELADGLAYWAAYYQPIVAIPRASGRAGQPRLASAALADIPFVPRARRHRRMMPSLDARASEPAFIAIAGAARAAPGQEASFLGDLTATFARLYLRQGAHAPIQLLHAVTGPAALRLLLPHLEPGDRADAMVYAWQTAAGLWSSFAPGPAPDPRNDLPAPSPADWDAALARAIDGGDVHAIKLAEVCRRESRLGPGGAIYLAAANDVGERL